MVLSSMPSASADASCDQGVVDVERALQGKSDPLPAPAERGGPEGQDQLVDIGSAHPHHAASLELVRKTSAPGVVGVDHRDIGPVCLEEPRLRAVVLLHRSVMVEVLAAQVGERGDVEGHRVHPVLGEGVGGDLERDRLRPFLAEVGECRLEDRCLRRGADAVEGADDTRRDPGVVEHGANEMGHRRLAVGPRHADGGQRACRMSVERGRDLRHRGSDRRRAARGLR